MSFRRAYQSQFAPAPQSVTTTISGPVDIKDGWQEPVAPEPVVTERFKVIRDALAAIWWRFLLLLPVIAIIVICVWFVKH